MPGIFIRTLHNLGLNLQGVRRQEHDNRANVIGHKAGVQSRIINSNSRASHNLLNPINNDMPKASF